MKNAKSKGLLDRMWKRVFGQKKPAIHKIPSVVARPIPKTPALPSAQAVKIPESPISAKVGDRDPILGLAPSAEEIEILDALQEVIAEPISGQHAEGYYGVAAADVAKRRKRIAEGLPPYTEEEKGKWETVTEEDYNRFLYYQMPMFVHSSNVESATYYPDEKRLRIQYHGGGRRISTYDYDNVDLAEAEAFLRAPSKGSWCWNYLRVRGSKTAHKKPYRRVN